jgi:hypothetical protein
MTIWNNLLVVFKLLNEHNFVIIIFSIIYLLYYYIIRNKLMSFIIFLRNNINIKSYEILENEEKN